MKYDIYLSDYKRQVVLQLPIIPSEMPSITKASKNEEFETYNDGTYNIIGDVGLTEFSLECWLPGKNKNYDFQRVKDIDPDKYIQLIDTSMLNKKPLRVIIVRSDGTYFLNNTFSVESFDWYEDKKSDYVYSINFKQWREY